MNITNERLKELEEIEFKMSCLERGGVDNWDNYSDALEPYFEAKEQEEKLDEVALSILEELSSCAYEPSERGAGIAFTEDSQESIKQILRNLIKETLSSQTDN